VGIGEDINGFLLHSDRHGSTTGHLPPRVFPIGDETVGHSYSGPIDGANPFVLASDLDFGLYIFCDTG
jgi:hypothetical protein